MNLFIALFGVFVFAIAFSSGAPCLDLIKREKKGIISK